MVEVRAVERTAYYGPFSAGAGVSWSAVAAGALASIAATLVLLTLGAAIGLSVVSPWPDQGVKPDAMTVSLASGIYLVVVSLLASLLGGYIAGRLGSSWSGLHADEIYFRDTAHGFLAWALATVLGALFLASAATSIIGSATQGVTTGGAAALGTSMNRTDATGATTSYGTTTTTTPSASSTAPSSQIAQVAPTDQDTRQAAEAARKTGVHTALWSLLAMLVGAFTASFAATWGAPYRGRYID